MKAPKKRKTPTSTTECVGFFHPDRTYTLLVAYQHRNVTLVDLHRTDLRQIRTTINQLLSLK